MNMNVNIAQVDAMGFRAMLAESGLPVGQGEINDAFAQLLMALFGGGDQPEPEEAVVKQPEMVPEGTTAGKEPEQPKENAEAMQMAAEFLLMNQVSLPELQNLLVLQEEAVVQETGESVQSVEKVLVPVLLEGKSPVVQQVVTETEKPPAEAAPTVISSQEAPKGFPKAVHLGAEIPVLSVEKSAADTSSKEQGLGKDTQSFFDGQMKFSQSVAEVRRSLEGEQEKKPVESAPVDIGALQQKVDAERPNMTAVALREKTQTFQTRDSIVSQMKENVLKNLSGGDSEFTIKLKPESLGEITVKMVQSDGKISMSIVTASTQTAKLLNESIDALKNSLRPLQAEVREIIPRPEQANTPQQSGFFGSGFESFQHQQHFTGQSQQPRYYADILTEETAEEENVQAEALSGLNAYV